MQILPLLTYNVNISKQEKTHCVATVGLI